MCSFFFISKVRFAFAKWWSNWYILIDFSIFFKALRDAEKWKLASYHIATLFLHESNEMVDKNFWKTSIGTLFVHVSNKKKSLYLYVGMVCEDMSS